MITDGADWIQEVLVRLFALGEASASRLSVVDWAVLGGILLFQRLCVHLGMWAYCLAVLPGTALHEAMHWLVAMALRARPSMPSIIPVRTASGWRLGSVQFRAGYLRALPIALAPLVLAPLGFWWATTFLPGKPWGAIYLAHAWISVCAFGAGFPSRQDWSIAAPALVVGGLVVGLATLALYLYL